MNWCCCTIVINAGFSSKLFASIVGYLTAEYSSWIIGLQKSSIVLDLLFLYTSSSSSGIFCNLSLLLAIFLDSALVILLRFCRVLSISVYRGNRFASGLLCI